MSKTVAVPTGDHVEYLLGVTVDDLTLSAAIYGTSFPMRQLPAAPGEGTLRRPDVDGYNALFAQKVGVASILTGRNIKPEIVVPWGSMSIDGRLVSERRYADRGYGGAGRETIFDYLEDSEYDPASVYTRDERDPTPPLRWLCYGLEASAYHDGDGFNADDDEAHTFRLAASELAETEDRLGLSPCAWELVRE